MVAERLMQINSKIFNSAKKIKKSHNDIKLVAVSKNQPISKIQEAIHAGQTIFGENRIQEATKKFIRLKQQHAKLKLHLIGALQNNKIKEAIALFDVIETVDRPKLAEKLAYELAKTHRQIKLMIQVNTGNEPQKSGVSPPEADQFIKYCRKDLKLPIIGLMCIPPVHENPRPHFMLLADLAKQNQLTELSMGMSADFETAIQYGATYVRVGTAIFGERDCEKHLLRKEITPIQLSQSD